MRNVLMARATRTRYALAAIVTGLIVLSPTAVLAIAKGYQTDDDKLVSGMVVSLSNNDSNTTVSRASRDSATKVVGIAMPVSDSTVAITSRSADVYVESQGEVWAYVTDLNGEVKRGDLLTISPLRGMLMKAMSDGSEVIVALSADNFTTGAAEEVTLESGQKAHVEKILVNLDQKTLSALPVFQRLGRSLTGKTVSDLRVLVALVIFTIVMISEAAIVYGGVTSAINAIGRNPLAREYIKKELLQVLAIVIAVLMVGMLSIYAILWI